MGRTSLVVTALAAIGLALIASFAAAGRSEAVLLGDANCDGAVAATDAAVVLQYDARLLDPLPCPENADTNSDGNANALDASLILQYAAGVLLLFPESDGGLPPAQPIATPAPCPFTFCPVMSLAVEGLDAACDGASCDVPVGSAFTLSVGLEASPDFGYIAFQSYILYGASQYNVTDELVDEIVWPDANGFSVRSSTTRAARIIHGASTGMLGPLPTSRFAGRLLTLSMTCLEVRSEDIRLLALDDRFFSLGSGLKAPLEKGWNMPAVSASYEFIDGMGYDPKTRTRYPMPIADRITINCVAP